MNGGSRRERSDHLEAANRRYLELLSAIEDPRAGRNKLDKLSQPVEQEGRRYAGFNLFDPGDETLLCSMLRGEFNISGLQNKSLRRHLHQLNSGQVSRLLKRLRTHGLLKKVGHTYKYYVITFGKQVVATALKLRAASILASSSSSKPVGLRSYSRAWRSAISSARSASSQSAHATERFTTSRKAFT